MRRWKEKLLGKLGADRALMLSRYASSTVYMAASLIAHAAGLIILARALGTEQFGLLTLITTGANLGLTWCGLGSGEVLRRMVSRDASSYPIALGHALTLLIGTGLALTLLCSLLLTWSVKAAPDPWTNALLITTIVFSNIVLFSWASLAEQILLAHDRFKAANIVNLASGLGRAVAVVLACLVFGVTTLQSYAWWHVGFYLIVALGCIVAVAGLGRPHWTVLWDEVGRGASISLAGLMIMLRKNADVLMVSAIASPSVVGIYAVASRIVATASVVTAALDRLVYSNLARAGRDGPSATLKAASRYAIYAMGLCAATSIGLLIAAPFVPLVFGQAYAGSVPYVQVLAATLFVTSLHWLAADAMTAAELHRERLIVEVVTGTLSIPVLIGLGYVFGMPGIVASLYISGALVVVGLWGTLWRLAQKQKAAEDTTP